MALIHTILGISAFPSDLQNLSLKYCSLQVVVSGIYLSYAWISLYYLSILDSFIAFGIIVSFGMLFGIFLDLPLGILTDRFGQRIAFCGALSCLFVYYFGLFFASKPIELLFLEIIVGIYSALLSGSFNAWFMNTWESISSKGNEVSFRNVMGSINFAKTIVAALAAFIGGFLLYQTQVHPKIIFLLQAVIAAIGVFLGLKFISSSSSIKRRISRKEERMNLSSQINNHDLSRFTRRIQYIKEKYFFVTPFFVSFSLLSFTSISFSTVVFSSLLYDLCSPIQIFNRTYYEIQFASISIILISMIRSISDIIFAVASRLSGKITSFINSPYQGLLIFYTLNYPVSWIVYLCILFIDFSPNVKLNLVILTFFLRIILIGLTTGLYWQLYLNITSSETRSSQESLFNTIYLLLSIIGYGLLGVILEFCSFVGSLIYLLAISCLGILLLVLVKNPDHISSPNNRL
ncbi:MAG: MFS transporter [Candidatus Heimdallarchaeota archaeon]|nr:MAG: MFS transporter [Candidatus Heimdallarchaeota archaeon]